MVNLLKDNSPMSMTNLTGKVTSWHSSDGQTFHGFPGSWTKQKNVRDMPIYYLAG